MIKRTLKTALLVAVTAGLTACGGGGGGGNYSTGGTYFTHEELAHEFVRRVNVDVAGYLVSLQKINTLQTDYIVVYDYYYGTYDAYWLGNYNPGENIANYLNAYDPYFYYDLIPRSGNVYEDPYTGILFQKIQPISKNLARLQAIGEQNIINKMANDVRATYGLSKEKALLTARFAFNLQSAPKGTYTAKDYDAFLKETIGSTYTDIRKDLVEGNKVSLAQRIATAAEVSGMGSDGVNKWVTQLFGN